jgi:general secretion pathway protein G
MKKAGFSLVELLIAATIIALLAGIGVTSYSALTTQSRNSRRKADLENLRSALELYRADNDYYPADLSTLESDNYLTKLLDDPKSGRDYAYCPTETAPDFSGYSLYASLEGETGTVTPSCSESCGDTDCNYELTPLGEE